MTKPEPCPFCASTAIIMRSDSSDSERDGYRQSFKMVCSHCYASTAPTTYYPFPQDRRPDGFTTADEAKDAAMAAWNRRTPT